MDIQPQKEIVEDFRLLEGKHVHEAAITVHPEASLHLIIPEERAAFHEAGGHSKTGCPQICGIAARIAAEVLLDIKERAFRATRQDS